MKDRENIIGNNIKNLRVSFGVTQWELALSLGLSSPNTLSNYEKGIRSPDNEMLKKLSRYFGVTETELINGDFSRIPHISEEKINALSSKIAMEKLFPVVFSENALKHPDFQKAFGIQGEFICALIEGKTDFSFERIKICTELYERAAKDNIPEAVANILFFSMLFGLMKTSDNEKSREYFPFIQKNGIKLRDYLSMFFSYDELYSDEETEDAVRKEFLKNNEVEIISNILTLKKSCEYYELGEYYFALRFLLNLISNSQTEQMNRTIGTEILLQLSLSGNKYADRFFEKS